MGDENRKEDIGCLVEVRVRPTVDPCAYHQLRGPRFLLRRRQPVGKADFRSTGV